MKCFCEISVNNDDEIQKHFCYNRTIELLEALILEYENMFIRLEEQKTEVEKKISILSTKHNDTTGTTNHYVLASSTNKEQILNSIPEEVKTNILSETLSEEIHKAYACKNYRFY